MRLPLLELEFKELSCKQVLPLRTKILRPNFPPDTLAHFAEDRLEQTLHFGLITPEQQVLAIATVFPQPFPHSLEEETTAANALQLRGMAVDTAFQARGLGKILIEALIPELASRFSLDSILWCHARQSAAGFYIRLEFLPSGTPFHIADIGPHIVMWRGLFARVL